MVTVFIIAPIVAYIVEIVVGRPSVAILEIYGVIIVGFYLATLAYIVNGK
jgi:hypothetical membrane protein